VTKPGISHDFLVCFVCVTVPSVSSLFKIDCLVIVIRVTPTRGGYCNTFIVRYLLVGHRRDMWLNGTS